MTYKRFEPGFRLGSEGDGGEHQRGTAGWPYSIYLQDNTIGGCDAVLCHGIQDLPDAVHLCALLNEHRGTAPLPRNSLFWSDRNRKPVATAETTEEMEAALDEAAERRAAPVCRICGEEGHTQSRCGND